MNMDFTIRKYMEVCDVMKELPLPIVNVNQFLENQNINKSFLILRHDVDRSIKNALNMAKIESDLGIHSTYYFRMTRFVFDPSVIKEIYQLGHEIGYHYEVVSKARGNIKKAMEIFRAELELLRRIVPIKTISMHGNPLKPWNNLDLWNQFNFINFGIKGDVTLSIDYSNMYYFTDTGRSWDEDRNNIRDHMDSKKPDRKIITTDQLIFFLKNYDHCSLLLNIHPNRWSLNLFNYVYSFCLDWIANQAKWLISLSHKL